MDIASALVAATIAIAFLYLGYRDDYKRNPKEFLRTPIALPLSLFAMVLGLGCMANRLQNWANQAGSPPCELPPK